MRQLSYAASNFVIIMAGSNEPGAIYIAQLYDGKSATPGNGVMPALRAQTRAQVDEVFASGLAASGTDDGKPGIREEYTPHFYVAYLRDPIGIKV